MAWHFRVPESKLRPGDWQATPISTDGGVVTGVPEHLYPLYVLNDPLSWHIAQILLTTNKRSMLANGSCQS